jgi:hypothetical protein
MDDKKLNSDQIDIESFQCPYCKHNNILNPKHYQIFYFEKIRDLNIKCPLCKNFLNITLKDEKTKDEKKIDIKKKENKTILKTPPYIYGISFGITFISIGIIFLFISMIENLQLATTFIIMGFFSSFLIYEKKRKGKILSISEKIVIIINIWVVITFLLINNSDMMTYFIVIFIGYLITKELAKQYLPKKLDLRMKIIVVVFFAIYIISIPIIVIPYLI